MFRQSLLPHAYLAISLGATMLIPTTPSWGQDRSTDERLDRLERDLNMLQRQVYRGEPPPGTGGESGSAVDVEVRMERIEQQMRDLTGRFEEIANQVGQLHQRLEQVNSDIEMRVGQTAGAPAAEAGPSRGPLVTPRLPRPEFAGPPAALRFPGEQPDEPRDDLKPPSMAGVPGGADSPPDAAHDGPTPIFGTLTPPGSNPPSRAFASAEPPPAVPPSGGGLPNGSSAEQYNYAFGLVRKTDYPGAETALKAFLQRHPTDRLAGSAQYWLGETYYTRGRYADAASAFAEGYKRYPKSPKAADDLLKLAMSLARTNQKQNACLALAQLDHDFPNGAGTIKEHAAMERKRLGC